MNIPEVLKLGDTVAIVAPAKCISEKYLQNAKELIESWGLVCKIGKNAAKQNGFFSGSDDERTSDLQWALDDEVIKAVFCARGGYGTIRIIDQLNFTQFQKSPKWII